MALPYKLFNEVNDRYVGTIIYYGDLPVYIVKALPGVQDLDLLCTMVGDNRNLTSVYHVTDPLFRDGPFQLGYVNKLPFTLNNEIFYGASYMTRIPRRQWKQGLTPAIVEFSPKLQGDFYELLVNPMFKDMLQGNYPTLAQARNLLNGKLVSVAFSRQLAISKDDCDIIKLHYRGKTVGLSEDGAKFKLRKEYSFLKEFSEASGVLL